MATVSVLILTLNESDNLPRCMQAVGWSDDILVLDSFSTDDTVEVAKRHGARVMQREFDGFAGQRNFGLEHGQLVHDWVLHLDADEVVSDALRDEIVQVIETTDKQAFYLASKMTLHGKWLKYSGMYPAYQARFGRRDSLKFVQVGHGQRETLSPDQLGTLREPLIHYSFSKGMADWFERHNRYSTDEAAKTKNAEEGGTIRWADLFSLSDRVRRRRALKELSGYLPCRPLLRFLYMYVLRLGFLDGREGFTYCRLLAIYESMIVLKQKELRRRRQGKSI